MLLILYLSDHPVQVSKMTKDHICVCRLLRFIPGLTLYEVDPWTKEHFFPCGQFVAKMDLSLQTFKHPGGKNIKDL